MRIKVVALGSAGDFELQSGATVADAAADARVPANLNARVRGLTVTPDERDSVSLNDGDTVIFVAPELKHGR